MASLVDGTSIEILVTTYFTSDKQLEPLGLAKNDLLFVRPDFKYLAIVRWFSPTQPKNIEPVSKIIS